MRTIRVEVFDGERSRTRPSFCGLEDNGNRALTARRNAGSAGVRGDLEIAGRGYAADTKRVSSCPGIAEGYHLCCAGRSDGLRSVVQGRN